MTRTLLLVFVVSLTVAAASLSAAFGLGPIEGAFGAFKGWAPWSGRPVLETSGPDAERRFAWDGGERLQVDLPAGITYTQSPEASVVVLGPKDALDRVRVEGGEIGYRRGPRPSARLEVIVSAPAVETFVLKGAQSLSIDGYDGDELEIEVFGSGEASGRGRARSVSVKIAGSGAVDLADVTAEEAEVEIAGSGKAVVSPVREAEVRIAGSGEAILTTRPARLESKVAGSGRIVQGGETLAR